MSAGTFAAPVAGAGFVGLKSNSSNVCPGIGSIEWNKKIVSNGSKTHCMKVGCNRRKNSQMPGYIDGRCLTLWKLAMFGCSDSSQVYSLLGIS